MAAFSWTVLLRWAARPRRWCLRWRRRSRTSSSATTSRAELTWSRGRWRRPLCQTCCRTSRTFPPHPRWRLTPTRRRWSWQVLTICRTCPVLRISRAQRTYRICLVRRTCRTCPVQMTCRISSWLPWPRSGWGPLRPTCWLARSRLLQPRRRRPRRRLQPRGWRFLPWICPSLMSRRWSPHLKARSCRR